MLQPSEAVKLVMVIYFAYVYAKTGVHYLF
ncbi:hypothetical protein ACEQPO_23070 [Bacillus sp. SL00103]